MATSRSSIIYGTRQMLSLEDVLESLLVRDDSDIDVSELMEDMESEEIEEELMDSMKGSQHAKTPNTVPVPASTRPVPAASPVVAPLDTGRVPTRRSTRPTCVPSYYVEQMCTPDSTILSGFATPMCTTSRCTQLITVGSVSTANLPPTTTSTLDLSPTATSPPDLSSTNSSTPSITPLLPLLDGQTLAPFLGSAGMELPLPLGVTAISIFERFFDDSFMDLCVIETNRYGRDRLESAWRDTNTAEMRKFFGVLIAMGIVEFPRIRDYWSRDDESGWNFPFFSKVMPGYRFEELYRNFHLVDSKSVIPRGQPGHDRLNKVRPLLDHMNKAFFEQYSPGRELAVDERMLSFKGRVGFKQYMPAKPIKWGLKSWVLAESASGYTLQFDVYTGKQENSEGCLTERVVLELLEKYRGKNHILYMDNFYSSPTLFSKLLQQGVYACGTIRFNRKGLPDGFTEAAKSLKSQDRGSYVSFSVSGLLCLAWKDTKVVKVISNCYHNTTTTVRRRKKGGDRVDVVCLAEYNKYMGGVDVSDYLMQTYSIVRRASRWWMKLALQIIDCAIVNAFIIAKKSGQFARITHLAFRKQLAIQLASPSTCTSPSTSSNAVSPRPARLRGRHFPEKLPPKSRCVVCIDRMSSQPAHQTIFGCSDCGVHLCVEKQTHSSRSCFEVFHTVEHFRTIEKTSKFKFSDRKSVKRRKVQEED